MKTLLLSIFSFFLACTTVHNSADHNHDSGTNEVSSNATTATSDVSEPHNTGSDPDATLAVEIGQEPIDVGLTDQEKQTILERHNFWRADVGVGPLKWSDKLAEAALSWGKQLSSKGCKLIHSDLPYGENLFMGSAGDWSSAEAVEDWASEKKDYTYGGPINGKNGHYTQLIWAKTTTVGCAKIRCGNNEIWICEYDPAGNMMGQKPY